MQNNTAEQVRALCAGENNADTVAIFAENTAHKRRLARKLLAAGYTKMHEGSNVFYVRDVQTVRVYSYS